jgi:hypothetical protein
VTHKPHEPRVFVDADVLFAGAASPSEHSASLVVLRLAEITLIEALTSEQVIAEAERNLADKLPQALPAFRLIASRCLRVVPDPDPAHLLPHAGLAHPKDLPILVAAAREDCAWLITFNVGHFQPGHPSVTVVRPGEFVLHVRDLLARLDVTGGKAEEGGEEGE